MVDVFRDDAQERLSDMIESTKPESTELTDQDAEALLVVLARHFKEPVSPLSRYSEKLRMWAGAMAERAAHMKRTLYPALDSKDPRQVEEALEEYRRERDAPESDEDETRRQDLVDQLRGYEEMAEHVQRTFLAIEQANVLQEDSEPKDVVHRESASGELTDDEAEALLVVLSRYFKEPVRPINRYCKKLRTWAGAISERAWRLKQTLYPALDSKVDEQWGKALEEYQRDMKAAESHEGEEKIERQRLIEQLRDYEKMGEHVHRTFLAIDKSNLLARILYSGEKMRTQMCPEHKGRWSGIEWGPDNACPHRCQLTGWIQEEQDAGKPLPGVYAVQMVPTGEPDQVTVIRGTTGEVLGKARIMLRSEDLPKRLG